MKRQELLKPRVLTKIIEAQNSNQVKKQKLYSPAEIQIILSFRRGETKKYNLKF